MWPNVSSISERTVVAAGRSPLGLCEEWLQQWSGNLSFLLLCMLATFWTQVALQPGKKYLLESSWRLILYFSALKSNSFWIWPWAVLCVIFPKRTLRLWSRIAWGTLPKIIHCYLAAGLCKLVFIKCLPSWLVWAQSIINILSTGGFALQQLFMSGLAFPVLHFSLFLALLFIGSYLECH